MILCEIPLIIFKYIENTVDLFFIFNDNKCPLLFYKHTNANGSVVVSKWIKFFFILYEIQLPEDINNNVTLAYVYCTTLNAWKYYFRFRINRIRRRPKNYNKRAVWVIRIQESGRVRVFIHIRFYYKNIEGLIWNGMFRFYTTKVV